MSDELDDSLDKLQHSIAAMALRTRITELKGIVVSGRALTPEQSKELADLELRLATLRDVD
jgi:hypothetical protein